MDVQVRATIVDANIYIKIGDFRSNPTRSHDEVGSPADVCIYISIANNQGKGATIGNFQALSMLL